MANSKSAPPDSRNALLCDALLTRRAEMRQSWEQIMSAECLESLESIAPQVKVFLSGLDFVGTERLPSNFTWLTCDADFWTCMQAIALGGKLECRPADKFPVRLPPGMLKKLSSADRVKVLLERYRCPINIGAASEVEVAEELLRQLMVVERAKLETGAAFDADGVLLGINLLGIRALVTHDLRLFDALNYFYELPSSVLVRLLVNSRLFAFWLCIYAQLLSKPDWLKCA